MFAKTWALAALAALVSAAPVPAALPQITGSGVLLKNAGTLKTEYCFFNNIANGDGTAIPNFTTPQQCETLAAGASQFVPLSTSFKGRITRTTSIQSTWVEVQVDAGNGVGWADVSIEQGCDGPVTVEAADGSGTIAGFTTEIVSIAPAGTTVIRQLDGATVLDTTMGNWFGAANSATADFAAKTIDPANTYITGGSGVTVVPSSNQAFIVTFY